MKVIEFPETTVVFALEQEEYEPHMTDLTDTEIYTQPSCFNCDDLGGGMYKPHEEETVWYIGLAANGQAHYACADCKDHLFNVTILHPL